MEHLCYRPLIALKQSNKKPVAGTSPATAKDCIPKLVDREAIQQPVTAGRTQVGLRAAALGTARRMRRIPGLRGWKGRRTIDIRVAEHDGALRAARVVFAGHILVRRKGTTVRGRAGQNVVSVGLVAEAIDDFAFL